MLLGFSSASPPEPDGWTTKGNAARNPERVVAAPGEPDLGTTTGDETYGFGVSYSEQRSMSIFLKFLAASLPQSLFQPDDRAELQDYRQTVSRDHEDTTSPTWRGFNFLSW